jgi:hypothetical protein
VLIQQTVAEAATLIQEVRIPAYHVTAQAVAHTPTHHPLPTLDYRPDGRLPLRPCVPHAECAGVCVLMCVQVNTRAELRVQELRGDVTEEVVVDAQTTRLMEGTPQVTES